VPRFARPALGRVISLQKLQGQLQDPGALETIAHYLRLLEDAYLVAAVPKYVKSALRQRSSPPKLVTLNNALVAVMDPRGVVDPVSDPVRFGAWTENACLAHAWNAGQRVSYWREGPYEVDGVFEGSWGSWAVEIKTGGFHVHDLSALAEFVRRHPRFLPLVICDRQGRATASRAGIASMTWQEFLAGEPLPGVEA